MYKKHSACISAAHPIAVEAGMSVLRNGGNAVDAAISISYMLGVVEPYASGVGGGGVMLVLPADGAEATVVDYREVAPMSGVISKAEVGVPGFVRGMEEAHARFGSMAIQSLLEPAIRMAEQGFPAGKALVRQLAKTEHVPREEYPQFYPEGNPLSLGDLLKQPLLADTMRKIQQSGADWFYEKELADAIAEKIEGMDKNDLRKYNVSIKKPVYSQYDEFQIITAPPPFGGVTLVQALKLSEALDLHKYSQSSAAYYHLWGEIINKCYALRKSTLGDPDFNHVPVEELVSNTYMRQLADQISLDALSYEQTPQDVANTTHFVVTDASGMCVSVTNTIGGFFSTGISVGGFFLNNQLRNFTADPLSPNQPHPGKRPQSYIAPTILRNQHDRTIVIGASGGKRIPMTLAMIIMKIVKQQLTLEDAISSSRVFIDDGELYAETPLDLGVTNQLVQLGYKVQHNPDPMYYGGVQGLIIHHESSDLFGASDPRRGGAWMKEDLQ